MVGWGETSSPALPRSVESRSLKSPVTVAVIGIVCTLASVISANEWAPAQTAAPPHPQRSSGPDWSSWWGVQSHLPL